MNRCFPTAFHWTLLSSGMNARWRQESFVSATVSCPSFKQTGTSKPLQVYLGASAGAQLLSSYLQGCSFSSCPEQLWNQHFKDSSEGGESSVHLQFALQHPQRCGTRWHPCVNPVLARQRQRQRALCGSLAHTHAHRDSTGSVWIPQSTLLPPEFIQCQEKKKMNYAELYAQVRKPQHSLVFVEDSLGRVMERLGSGEWSGHFIVVTADQRHSSF